MDRLIELLRNSNLSWLVPNLRQDYVIWNGLNDPDFFEKFIQSNPSGSGFTEPDFAPGRLALIALDQTDAFNKSRLELIDSIEERVLQLASNRFIDQKIFQITPQDLQTSGHIALVLADKYGKTNSWNGLVDLILAHPGDHWFTPLACLYGFWGEDIAILKALVQPGASVLRINLAVHVVLSNPLLPEVQLSTLLGLCQGDYGDLLPANERLWLLRSIQEQRPQVAYEFCQQWIEKYPLPIKPGKNFYNHPIESLYHLSENLFQIEVNKIAGKSRNISELLEIEDRISAQIADLLNSHHLSQVSRYQSGKSLINKLSEIREKITQTQNQKIVTQNTSLQAELAVILAEQGFYEDAYPLIPQSDSPLPEDPLILYSISKVSHLSGSDSRAVESASLLMQLLDQKSIQNTVPVWGEYLSWHNLGKLLLDLKMPEQAAHIFEIALRICPNDLSLLLLLADSYKYSHQDHLAIKTLKILVSLNFENLEYHRFLAQHLETIGEWESSLPEREYIVSSNHDPSNTIPLEDLYAYAKCALYANHFPLTIDICKELLTKNQEDSQAMIYLGEAYMRMGETSKGMEFLVQAAQISPHMEECWIALAEAQKNIYPVKTVIETLSAASKVVPNSSRIHFTLGEIYLMDHSPTLALPELFTAATLSPEDPQILFNYGRALKLLGNIDESKAVLTRAYQINPNFPGLAQFYASLLMDQGALEEAKIPLELIIKSNTSKDVKACMNYARVVLALNKQDPTKIPPINVLVALNDVLQNDPTNAEAKVLIAETLAATGDHEMAFQAYREALDTPLIDDKHWLERISFGFGCVASAIGKFDIAIAALQEAGQADPTNPEIFKALSKAFYSANLLEDSIRSARNVLVIDGDNPDNLAWFAKHAILLISNKKADLLNSQGTISKTIQTDALNALTKALQLAPTRSDLILQLGNLQSKIGAVADAQDTFTSIAQLDFATIDDLINASDYLSGIGNHKAAITCLENAVGKDQRQENKHDPSLYIKLAHEHVKNNDHTSAINTLDQAIGILPEESTILSQKIYLLLDLGQPIDALNCIEKAIHENPNEDSDIDLIFLASKIYRSIGDFFNASKMALKGIAIATNNHADTDLANLPKQYRTQASEIFRALIQPDRAFRIIKDLNDVSENDFLSEQDYLDFLCLHTELALETGDQIRPEVQDIQLEISNPSFSRLMAIKARLMNQAGNHQQAEQVLQIGINNYLKQDFAAIQPTWSIPHIKYLNMNSIIEAANELGFWDLAVSGALRIIDFSSGEPLTYLNLAKSSILEAEFFNLCKGLEVMKHKPSPEIISKETFDQLRQYLDNVKAILASYKTDVITQVLGLSDDQIYRWQARANIAFKQYAEIKHDPADILIQPLTPDDCAALICHYHQINIIQPESQSINKIIKIARAYPRNPSVMLQVAFALYRDNPLDAMRSLQVVLEQQPYSNGPAIALCNILLAKIALNSAEFEIAKSAVETAMDIWQDEPAWHMLAAQIYRQLSDPNAAIRHLGEATHLDPKNITYHLELGKMYFENADEDPQQMKQALNSFEHALELDPDNITALVSLANTQFKLNDLENAELIAQKALVIAPERAELYQLLGDISIRSGDFQAAYDYGNHAIQINPKNPQSTILVAQSLSAMGRNHEALLKLNTMLPASQDPKALYLERVKIIQQLHGQKAGLVELQKLLESYPEDFTILTTLAQLYVDLGETENAISVAQQALNVNQDRVSRNEQASIHIVIGKLFRQTGQLDQSIFHLNEAIQLAPERLEPYLELGLARKERREYQEAIHLFEQATTIAPEDPRAPYQAGLALKESKDYRSSETMLRRAVNLAPHDLNIRRQLAAVVALNLVHNPRTGRNDGK